MTEVIFRHRFQTFSTPGSKLHEYHLAAGEWSVHLKRKKGGPGKKEVLHKGTKIPRGTSRSLVRLFRVRERCRLLKVGKIFALPKHRCDQLGCYLRRTYYPHINLPSTQLSCRATEKFESIKINCVLAVYLLNQDGFAEFGSFDGNYSILWFPVRLRS